MKRKDGLRSLFADPDGARTPAGPGRAGAGTARTMLKAMEHLNGYIGPQTLPAFASKAEPSVAPLILHFAIGDTAHCSAGRSCAHLYLALQGMSIPVSDTTVGMDLHHRGWWLRAMAEHAVGLWSGNQEGVKAIASVHPEIFEQAQAATSTADAFFSWFTPLADLQRLEKRRKSPRPQQMSDRSARARGTKRRPI